MVYVQRDEKGGILRLDHEPFDGMTQTLSASDPEVRIWFAGRGLHDHLMALQRSDLELVRVIDDLVQVLVSLGLLNYTDLPEPARRKLQHRAEARSRVRELGGLLTDETALPY
ncbi:tryptophan synthase subunit beta [Pseudomonas sp. CR3202]|uniref:tryptophan synthase subunit beta n=1 Tax=Pseudomonas sp. CR3202 TaxID=3351532 RepID=UPI003BF1386E